MGIRWGWEFTRNIKSFQWGRGEVGGFQWGRGWGVFNEG